MPTREQLVRNLLANHKGESIVKNLLATQRGNYASRFRMTGLNRKKFDFTKLNSKSYKKLMQRRGKTTEQIEEELASMDRSQVPILVRHAGAGEKYVVTHGCDGASGNYVSFRSQGKTPEERIDSLALWPKNTAEYETMIVLDKDQDVFVTRIAPQPGWQGEDPKHLPRNGGAWQIMTDGGFKNGAVRQQDPKFPSTIVNTGFPKIRSTSTMDKDIDYDKALEALQAARSALSVITKAANDLERQGQSARMALPSEDGDAVKAKFDKLAKAVLEAVKPGEARIRELEERIRDDKVRKPTIQDMER